MLASYRPSCVPVPVHRRTARGSRKGLPAIVARRLLAERIGLVLAVREPGEGHELAGLFLSR